MLQDLKLAINHVLIKPLKIGLVNQLLSLISRLKGERKSAQL
jgi:hypothetical protein